MPLCVPLCARGQTLRPQTHRLGSLRGRETQEGPRDAEGPAWPRPQLEGPAAPPLRPVCRLLPRQVGERSRVWHGPVSRFRLWSAPCEGQRGPGGAWLPCRVGIQCWVFQRNRKSRVLSDTPAHRGGSNTFTSVEIVSPCPGRPGCSVVSTAEGGGGQAWALGEGQCRLRPGADRPREGCGGGARA